MKQDYETEIVLRVLIKDVENAEKAAEYIEDFVFGVKDMIYSTDEWDDHYELVNIGPSAFWES